MLGRPAWRVAAILDGVLEALTGTGLAASAGLNAYVPLLTMGLLARYSDLVTLPSGWQWLSNGWVITILLVLLVIEVVADKVPMVDHVNDVVQTAVRPTAGGLVFGAGTGAQTVTVDDPGRFFGSQQWVPIVIGMVIALAVHAVKAAARPVINTTTAGFGTPLASAVEDAGSVLGSLVAILLPALVLLFLLGFVFFVTWVVRRRRRRRRERQAVRDATSVGHA
jgi:hypothetical protein